MASHIEIQTWGHDITSTLFQALIWLNIDPSKLQATDAFDIMLEKLICKEWDLNNFLVASKHLAVKDPGLYIMRI